MFCINCSNTDTKVTNSRPSKKTPQIWRRRRCPVCKYTFTTDELPRMIDIVVRDTHNTHQPFNPGILIVSITKAFAHDPSRGAASAWDLAQTIISHLFLETYTQLTTDMIARTTYEVLDRYDPTAAAQYALSHQLMTSLRRRGRPSFGAASAASLAPGKQE